jgi:hypothetical protein
MTDDPLPSSDECCGRGLVFQPDPATRHAIVWAAISLVLAVIAIAFAIAV